MASRVTITENEILDELRASLGVVERPRGFYSVSEMVKKTGQSKDAVRKQIAAWKATGRLECVTVREPDITGRRQHIRVYGLKKKK